MKPAMRALPRNFKRSKPARGVPLSTGSVARYCHVTVASVCNWIKQQKLKAYTTPGGQYRVDAQDLIDFLNDNKIPVPDELQRGVSRRVLIVDDDAAVRKTLCKILQNHDPDLEVSCAGDGYQALIQMGHIKPDVVILDVRMPGLDGVHVCRQIKNAPELANTRVIAVTAFEDSPEAAGMLAEGAETCLSKPAVFKELAHHIDTVFART